MENKAARLCALDCLLFSSAEAHEHVSQTPCKMRNSGPGHIQEAGLNERKFIPLNLNSQSNLMQRVRFSTLSKYESISLVREQFSRILEIRSTSVYPIESRVNLLKGLSCRDHLKHIN